MNEFYYSYQGSKRTEIKNIIQNLDLSKYDTIVEPFGGSLAFSRYVFNLYPNKNYLISDVDPELTQFCNNFHKDKQNILNQTIKDINSIENKQQYKEYLKNKPGINDAGFMSWNLFTKKYRGVQEGLYPIPGQRSKPKFVKYMEKTAKTDEFFKKLEYKKQPFNIYLEQVKNDSKSLVFLDPPYMFLNNENYYKFNIREIYEYLLEYFKNCKCDYIFVHEYQFIMNYLFGENIVNIYDKQYYNTKFKASRGKYEKHNVQHCVISNIPKKDFL